MYFPCLKSFTNVAYRARVGVKVVAMAYRVRAKETALRGSVGPPRPKLRR